MGGEGITGIKGLASRELTYRLSFMACSVQVPPQCFTQCFRVFINRARSSMHPAKEPCSSQAHI